MRSLTFWSKSYLHLKVIIANFLIFVDLIYYCSQIPPFLFDEINCFTTSVKQIKAKGKIEPYNYYNFGMKILPCRRVHSIHLVFRIKCYSGHRPFYESGLYKRLTLSLPRVTLDFDYM